MTAIIPAPVYSLPSAAWVPTLVIWHADGRFTRLEDEARRAMRGGAGRELAVATSHPPSSS